MKLTIFILTITLMQVSAASFGQKMTLKSNKISLEKVFKEIKKQTGYDVVLYSEGVKLSTTIKVDFNNATLESVMDKTLADLQLTYEIEKNAVIIRERERTFIQKVIDYFVNIDVMGKVTDENGSPLAGANVKVLGTSQATTTDGEGKFTIKSVAEDKIIEVTYIGFEPRKLKVSATMNITLNQSTAKLEEVNIANTGYQTLKPNEINGSVVVIDNKQLNQQVGTNILKRLDGMVSGLIFNIGKNNSNPQNKTGISIRGLATINGPLDPLIVLDGFIYEGNIENINPNDIENVTVLKDAAAASIWGARAGNGVIVITTKKASFNQKMQLSFSTGAIVSQRPDLSSIPQLNVADYVDLEERLFNKGFFEDRINSTPYLALSPAVKVFLNRRLGLISADDSTSLIQGFKDNDARSQYEQLVYRNGVVQQHSLSLSGGNNVNSYVFSSAFDNSTGNLREKYKKLNLRFANMVQLTEKLRLNLETYYTSSKTESGQRPYGEYKPAERMPLYYDLSKPEGFDMTYNTDYSDTLANGRLQDLKFYPLEDYKFNRTSVNLQEINANVGINYALSSWLNAEVKYQYQVQQAVSEKVVEKNSYEARELINSLTSINAQTGALVYNVPNAGFRTLSNSKVNSYTLRGQLNFNRSFRNHLFNAIAGLESRELNGTGDSYRTYGYNANPLTYIPVDFVSEFSNFITTDPIGIPGAPLASKTLYRFTAFYLNGSWLYKGKYGLSASGRRDGSNIFGANTNDRFKPLWSVGASWNISNEPFFQSKIVNDLRLKIAYGRSGNVDLSKTAVPVASILGNEVNTNLPFSRIRQLNNPNLKWEQVQQLNIGAEFSAFNKRLTGSLEWYSKTGVDLYGPIGWDYTSFGISNTITQNVAHTKGKGVDFILQSKNLASAFSWTSSLLLSYNKTITKKYYGTSANSVFTMVQGGNRITPVVGKDIYGIVAYRFAGLDAEGNPQGYLKGSPSTDYLAINEEAGANGLDGNLVYFGTGTPRYFGAIMNTFTYKQLSLSINITGRFNYYFFKPALSYVAIINGNAGHPDYALRWQQPGDELNTTIPGFNYPNNPDRDYFYAGSSVHVLKGDHIRLQNLNFTFSPRFKKSNTVRNIQVYGNVANLGILWRANNERIDPDYPRGGWPSKTWALGLRCNF